MFGDTYRLSLRNGEPHMERGLSEWPDTMSQRIASQGNSYRR